MFVPGFGFKGEGKKGNYGIGIRPPFLISGAALPMCLQQPSASSGLQGAAAFIPEAVIPPPIAATTEMVEHWITSSFRPLRNLSGKCPPEVGEQVLWRGVKTGKRGNLSTKIEYFNGTVRGIDFTDEDWYLYVD